MMSKTHIAVGVASALAIAQTGSVESCVAAIVGGSVGGIIADCDIVPSRAHKDALHGRLIVVGIALVSLIVDSRTELGVCSYIVNHLGFPLVAGICLFAALTFIGAHTKHRSFTHSLVALAGFSYAVYLACELLLPFFVAGYVSHLVLDVTNKHPIRLFFPLKADVCLGLCSAKGTANNAVLVIGIAVSALLLCYRLMPLIFAATGGGLG